MEAWSTSKKRTPFAPGAAVGKRLESRAEDHYLAHASFNCGRERIFRKARSHGDEDSHRSAGRLCFCVARYGLRIFAQNSKRQRIGKNTSALQNLVRRAMSGRRPRRPAWFIDFQTLVYQGTLTRTMRWFPFANNRARSNSAL